NSDETAAIMRRWDEDEEAGDVLARSGWGGTVAMIGRGMADPTMFLPVAKIFSGVASGATALRMGADVAIAGAVGSAISEAGMLATTPEMDSGDYALNVGTATILSGILGTGAGALLTRSSRI